MINEMTYDVLVVGARCAGASVAMLLARHGLRVLAVDRAGYGDDTLSTHALMRGGVMQLHRWGVLPAILRRGTPSVRMTAFHYGEDVIEIDIRPGQGVAALHAPRRTVLDAALVDAARASGAEVRHGLTLLDLHRRDDGRVTGATLQDRDGRRIMVRAGIVVGADGVNSTVARLVGAPVTHAAQHACAVVFGYFPDIGLDGYHWYYNPGVSAGVIPTNDNQHCVFAAMPPSRLRAGVRHDIGAGFRAVLGEASAGLASGMPQEAPSGGWRVFAGRKGFLRQPHGPGWALLGDAGYFKDPLTAHGITDALRDAEVLANAIARGTDAALADYAVIRDGLSLPLFRASEAIASFGWDLQTIREHHQDLNAAMKQETAVLAEMPPCGQPAVASPHPAHQQEKAA
jgi:menaquinone-9 beta-reductase